jgi:excisionase family DNA binding protein
MGPLDQLRNAIAGLPPGTLVALPREALLEALGPSEVGISVDPAAARVDLTVAQIAQLFGRSPSTVRQWLESGALEGYKLFRREWRVTPAAFAAFQIRQRSGIARSTGSPARGQGSLGDWRARDIGRR